MHVVTRCCSPVSVGSNLLPLAGMTRSRELFIKICFARASCRAAVVHHRRSSRGAGQQPTLEMYSSLSSSGPIKWNHNQESSLLQDVSPFSPAYDGRSTTTATLNERTRELYLQFLWLPEVRTYAYRPTSFFVVLRSNLPNIFFFVSYQLRLIAVRDAIESIREYDGSAAREAFFDDHLAG